MAYSILIVDDQREVIRVLEAALETLSERFIITGVLSGEEALLEARLSHIDLLISDIRLPGMSGLELFARIRILRPKVKTILVTGLQDEKTLETAANAGADAFFTKPITIEDFLMAVARILSLSIPRPYTAPAVETEAEVEEIPESSLSDRLTRLHKELPAETVLLINDRGEILIRAGNTPDNDLENAVLPSLMSIFSAGKKVSRSLGRKQGGNIFFFQGEETDLVMSPVGSGHGLVAMFSKSTLAKSSPHIHLTVREAMKDITGILAAIGVYLPTEMQAEIPPFLNKTDEEPAAAEIDETDEIMESLFETDAMDEISSEADDFWEPQEDGPTVGTISADGLSYEQALQLGLAPDEGRE